VIWRTVGVRCQGEAIARYHGLKKDHTMRLSRLTGFALISTGLASALMAMPRHTQATSWSPDGKPLAYMSDRDGNWNIYVVSIDGSKRLDGSGRIQLTSSSSREGLPSWSPDGTRLAFVSDRDGDFDVYVVDADGGASRG
jgi:Tol biopolymer transport system component